MLGPMKNHPHGRRARQSAFTLVEAMIVVAVVVVLLMLAAPSFRDLIEMQRLRSVNAQLVTDLQFARAEAVSRQTAVVLKLGATANAPARSCYTVYTCSDPNFDAVACNCNCMDGAGNACGASARAIEIRTVVIPADTGVEVGQPPAPMGSTPEVRFDPLTGGVQALTVDSDEGSIPVPWTGAIDTRRLRDATITLRTMVGLSGRPSVCAPLTAVSGFQTACAANN
jgi:type IV fimbrial biogenesis protein FimT